MLNKNFLGILREKKIANRNQRNHSKKLRSRVMQHPTEYKISVAAYHLKYNTRFVEHKAPFAPKFVGLVKSRACTIRSVRRRRCVSKGEHGRRGYSKKIEREKGKDTRLSTSPFITSDGQQTRLVLEYSSLPARLCKLCVLMQINIRDVSVR